MNLDLGPAFNRAQAVVNGLVSATPSSYSDDVDRARGVILNTVPSTEGGLAEPAPDVLLMDFAPSSVNLRLRWWIKADVPASRKVADAIEQSSRSTPRRVEGE